MSQRRLADIKKDFISNITPELKTPIATVNAAIEAMRNFNVLNDTKQTQEYLDISASELQRLSLLVDKVLKLSMFEKKEISLNKEWFNLEQLVTEVVNSMRLQFDKYKSEVSLNIYGDKLDVHINFWLPKTQTEDVLKGFKIGGYDYIRKPFSMEELIVRIENLLHIKQTEDSSAQLTDVIKLDRYDFIINRQTLTTGNDNFFNSRNPDFLHYQTAGLFKRRSNP